MAFWSRKNKSPPVSAPQTRYTPHPELADIKNAGAGDVTLVIPSKDRPQQLGALLRYFAAAGVKYPILVLLSGDKGRYCPADYPSLNITFREYDSDYNFFAKVKDGLAGVATPLVTMCTDDDLVLHEGIKKSAGFLMQNPDYSACQGYHALFTEEGNVINLARILFFTPSIDGEDPLLRLNAMVRRYQPVCWAVFRTPVMQNVAQNFWGDMHYIFEELLWSGSAVLAGKVKRLPLVYCLRRLDRIHLSGHPFFAMMENPQRFYTEYATYRAKLLAMLPPGGNDAARIRAFDLIHACYLARETVPGPLNYFTDRVLENPAASIHTAEIDTVLRGAPANFDTGWVREETRGGTKYRLFAEFLTPQPRGEIHLSDGFADALITEILPYFTAEQNGAGASATDGADNASAKTPPDGPDSAIQTTAS